MVRREEIARDSAVLWECSRLIAEGNALTRTIHLASDNWARPGGRETDDDERAARRYDDVVS